LTAATTSGSEVVYLVFLLVLFPVPAFIVGVRRGVSYPGVAFVPFVGAWIVIFRSIGTSAWLAIGVVVPLANLVIAIWAAFTVPVRHGMSRWWTLPFLIPFVNYVAFWAYAVSLPQIQTRADGSHAEVSAPTVPPCPKCGQARSSNSLICPHCGEMTRPRQR
jgi:ribosomal protein L32